MGGKVILILYAGGTIGMLLRTSGLTPGNGFLAELDAWLAKQKGPNGDRHVIEAVEPAIDSADAEPATWYRIARRIWDLRDQFDGAVVLHGTDTLAYTASALSFLLLGLAKPIIVTGAQIPFALPKTDAKSNLRGALAFAREERIGEVCVFFSGKLLRGNRSRKWSTRAGEGFLSPHWPELGHMKTAPRIAAESLLPHPSAVTMTAPRRHALISAGLVKLYPGISDRVIHAAANEHPHGLVLELYGSGTGPAASKAIRQALQAITLRGTPLVGVSQCSHGRVEQGRYASSWAFAECGVSDGHDLTPEAALTKLVYLQSLKKRSDRLAVEMARPLAGELTPRAI